MTAVATRPTTTTTTGIASSVTQHNHPNHLGKVGATHAILGRLPIQQDYTNYTTMDTPGGLRKADDFQGQFSVSDLTKLQSVTVREAIVTLGYSHVSLNIHFTSTHAHTSEPRSPLHHLQSD